MRYDEIHTEMTRGSPRDRLPGWALGLLRDIAAGRSPIRAVRHPLGFVCLPVERTGDAGVCVHIWSDALPRSSATTSQVHCHSWDLTSFVLYGQVRNVRAEVVDADAGSATHRVCAVISTPDGDEIEPTGRTVRHLPGRTEVYGAGDTYTLPAGVFHSSVVPAGGDAATIAVGVGRPGRVDLSLGPLSTARHRVTRYRCDLDETRRAALTAAANLTGTGR